MTPRDLQRLFAKGDLGATLREHFESVESKVDAIPSDTFLQMSDEEIVNQIIPELEVHPIQLDEENQHLEQEEIQIDVSRDPFRNIFKDQGPIYIPGIKVTVSIPYNGDNLLWNLRPNKWRSMYPRALVDSSNSGKGYLYVIIELPSDVDQEQIKKQFDDTMESIRFYLESQREQLSGENAKLPNLIRMALDRRRDNLEKHKNISDVLGIPKKSRDTRSEPKPPTTDAKKLVGSKASKTPDDWDVFVSHASEDKDVFVRPLAERLREEGLKIWYDEFTLKVGDSLRRSIDRGLSRSRYGIVVVSEYFLNKEWPQKELDGLVAREVDGRKVILPVWHNVDSAYVRKFSPLLSDRMATSSAKGLDQVVNELLEVILE